MKLDCQHTMDWRAAIRSNTRQSYVVIAVFIALFLALGLLLDVAWQSSIQLRYLGQTLPIQNTLLFILHGQVIPYASIFCVGFAVVAINVTLLCHQSIFLMGTNAFEILPATARNLQEQQLYHVVDELRIAASLPFLPKVFVIEADYMNAFASGWNQRSALIAITRGLLEKLDRSELQAVIAHELSHIRHLDIKLTLIASVLSNIMLLIVDFLYYSVLFSNAGNTQDNNGNQRRSQNQFFLIVLLLRMILPLLTTVLLLFLSRKREYMADAGAVELMRDNEPMARALIKISGDHQEHKKAYQASYRHTPHESLRQQAYLFSPDQAGISVAPTFMELFSTHPSIAKRLKALGFSSKND